MKLACGRSVVAKIRLPKLTLILTSPGYAFEASMCGKKKSTQALSTYYLRTKHVGRNQDLLVFTFKWLIQSR